MHRFIGQSDVNHIMTSLIKTIMPVLKISTYFIIRITACANRWILFVYLFALMLNVCRKLNYEISPLIICMWGVYFRQKYDKSWYWICQLYYTRIYIFIVLKISTYFIIRITACPVRLAAILAIMSVSTFKLPLFYIYQ
jgi:hypothetical protein